MTKKLVTLLFVVCMTVGVMGCTISTTGSASWELYFGFRTTQNSEEPSKVEFGPTILNKIVDSLMDDEISEDERRALLGVLWWIVQTYFEIFVVWDLF